MIVPGAGIAVVARVPVEPDREQARGWAVRELSGREYASARPGLLARAFDWLLRHLPTGVAGVPTWTLLVGTALLAGVVLYAVGRAGGYRRAGRLRAGPVLAASRLTAAEHRAAADRHAAAGDYSNAVLERFRAIARELEERAVLTAAPGRTADEVARDAAVQLPALRGDLSVAAARFDDVCYGGHAGTARADQLLRELDQAVRRARPVAAAEAAGAAAR
jgi:Domain of unknown function (DUF4129)